jgi:hypothetical protein
MPTLYAHRLNHGEGCGHSVELSLDDYTYEKDTTVHEITGKLMEAFIQDYIKTNTHDGDVIAGFVDTERMKRFLSNCVVMKWRSQQNAKNMTEQEKNFVIDAEIFFEDTLESAQVKEAA